MTSEWEHPSNDGWKDVDYKLLDDPDRNAHLSSVLNEACHVFYYHADGNWASRYKDHYAKLVAEEVVRFPGLTPRLLGTGDRVIKMVTYRAIELTGADGPMNDDPK